MAPLVWDQVGSRVYENGLDKGVLYLPDGSGVAWNGLTSVAEKTNQEVTPVFFEGSKVNDLVTLGNFSASMKAITYPDEFLDLEGLVAFKRGAYLADQKVKTFGLCYRTYIGNDFKGNDAGYKLHVVYNLTAIPSDTTYTSFSDDPSLVEFEWELTAVPNDVPGFRPTAHMILDSRTMDPWLLQDIEDMLYGSGEGDAVLVPIDDLVEYVTEWFRIKIIDNGDGTWSAIEHIEGANIKFLGNEEFKIIECNAIYLDDVTFLISDTLDVTDVPQIDIVNHGDGTWTAYAAPDVLIVMTTPDEFKILNANAIYINEYTYQLDDTLATTP